MRLIGILLVLFALTGRAQQVVRTFHDPLHMQVDEEITVSAVDGKTMEGP